MGSGFFPLPIFFKQTVYYETNHKILISVCYSYADDVGRQSSSCYIYNR